MTRKGDISQVHTYVCAFTFFCKKAWLWSAGAETCSFFSVAQKPPSGPGPHHFRSFTITLRHTTFVRTPLDGWSAQRRDTYLTTHNWRQTSMPPAGFEPTIPASERPKTHAYEPSAAGKGQTVGLPITMENVQKC